MTNPITNHIGVKMSSSKDFMRIYYCMDYQYATLGKEYPVDDDLVLWFTKNLDKYQVITQK